MAISAVSVDVKPCPILIDGKRQTSRGRTEVQTNPATGQPAALVPYCTAEEISAAVAAAQRAFPAWSTTPVLQRARVLFRYRQILEAHADELISLVTEENGKTREEAKGSFQRGLECVEFASGVPSLMMGETLARVAADVDTASTREPIGVCVGITPFNFPLMVPLWMFPIAIACGNTFVLKPSDRVPRSAVRAAELLYEAGLPAGVMNVVHGAKETVDALLADPRVKAVSFVGSSPVARYIYTTAAANGKRVQALGGAKNHSVVMPDCNLKTTVESVMASSFGCAGERCVATSVVVAVGEIGDKLVEELKKVADSMRLRPGWEPDATMGPVINPDARERILKYIDIGEKEGAKLVRDGRKDAATRDDGYFLGASIFDSVKPEMRIAKEEIFGPVLSVIRARDLNEALDIVNRSEHGNAASIYTRSGEVARRFAAGVQTGMVGVNLGVPAPVAFFPFSGWKNSFFGDAHALGKDAVRFYTETKVVTSRWPE
ncbi:MAG TPA: CoA-acylating methylmalonate-semialdehyde dehydrogenase [Terriglobales bacterium]|nr:CoA-acylating methylmalonate-semialdehyde dehydrogenase [Terriglobales bacterium]